MFLHDTIAKNRGLTIGRPCDSFIVKLRLNKIGDL